jgi:xanthine/CO dehydrogenase XdhC/CoxF family maturation factor
MIGSKTKVKMVFEILHESGLNPQKDSRVYTPISLAFESNNPPEISLSIVSEILKVTSQKSGELSRESIKEICTF